MYYHKNRKELKQKADISFDQWTLNSINIKDYDMLCSNIDNQITATNNLKSEKVKMIIKHFQ